MTHGAGTAYAWGGWKPVPQYRSARGLAVALQVVVWCTVASAAFAAFAYFHRAAVTTDLIDNGPFSVSRSRLHTADELVRGASAVFTLLSLTILVLIIIWMYRLAKNAEAQGRRGARLTPGWAIAGWLIPLANLVLPVLMAQDLWRASDPGTHTEYGASDWRRAKGSALIGCWWAAHIVSSMLAFRIGAPGEVDSMSDLHHLRDFDRVGGAAKLLSIVAAILLIAVVRQLTARQDALQTRVTPE
jgi:hypothetical protein